MAFEKGKVLKAAEKFLAQGKINAAIKEYRQLVDNDEDDLTALNMLGDLCVRAGKTDEAISSFQRIAEHYCEQEFTLKAIAMYKKIDRLKPRDPYIASKLANLYATQGLVVDARAQYLIVADAYTRAGQTRKALDIFHKIADLDSQNTDIRLKLAEGYLKEGMQTEAAEAFVEAGRRFYDARAFEKSLDSYSQAHKLAPRRTSILQGILAAHVALGTADEAIEILERAIEAQPEDQELVAMLLEACIEAEDAKRAEQATSLLVSDDPSNYGHLVPVARLYLKLGEPDDTTRILTSIIEQMLSGREEKELLEIINGVLTLNPEHIGALRLLVRVHWWQRDMEALQAALERLVEAAEASGLVDDERYALTQLVRLVPDEQRFQGRLNQLGGPQDDASEETLMAAGSLSEEPQFESFSIVDNEIPAGTAEAKEQFEWEVVGAEGQHDANASFAELNEPFDHSAVTFESEFEAHSAQEITLGRPPEKQAKTAPAGSEESSKSEAMMRQELESVDFYIAQGYQDIAADTLEMLEREFGLHPDIQSRREALRATEASTIGSAEVFEFGGADELVAEKEEVASQPPAAASTDGFDTGLAEIFEEFRLAAEDEHQPAKEDYETHYNMGTAYKEMDLLDDAIHEFQTAANLVRPGDGTSRFLQCCNMLAHCFLQKEMPRAAIMWLQKALDTRDQSEDEQKALRYELGLVFESIGENARALDLFTEVYGVDVGYREVGEKLRQLGGEKQKPTSKKN